MNDHLSALRLFARVAATGSFSRAGREVGVSQSSASRTIKALEQRLGVTLLRRTTRAVVLTDIGREYLAQIADVLSRLDDAEQLARGDASLRGSVRLAVPVSVAIRLVLPTLREFTAQHPNLRVDIAMADHRQEPVQDGIDVAISFGLAKDLPAKARRVATNERILVASPDYLRNGGSLTTPADLSAHEIIAGPVGRQPAAWVFRSGNRSMTVRVRPRVTLSVNEAAIVAAASGLGVLSTGYWGCRAELDSGALVRVLPDWKLGRMDMYVVLPQGTDAPRAARALADHLVESLRTTLRGASPEQSAHAAGRKQRLPR